MLLPEKLMEVAGWVRSQGTDSKGPYGAGNAAPATRVGHLRESILGV